MNILERKMNSQALTDMKLDLATKAPAVALDYDLSIAKFVEVASTMNAFDKAVHAYFFETYALKFADDIQKALGRVMECNGETIITSLINKLALKLPTPDLREFGYESDYHVEKARLTISSIIWHVLIDTSVVNYKTEVKRDGNHWRTITTVFLSGSTVKDLMKGMHFKPGQSYQKEVEGFKLKREHKQLLKRLSSIPFQTSDIATHEVIMKGYTLKDDWNKRVDSKGKRLKEHHASKVERFTSYADLIESLEGQVFYLELKYAASGRMFYKYQLEGMRSQGKLWETQMVDSAIAYDLTTDQELALKHHIYCGLTKTRVTPEEVSDNWDDAMLEEALSIDIMTATDQDDYGDKIVLRKAALALTAAMNGVPTRYMFGWDFTTSGLIVAGTSFRSEEMLKASNMHTESNVYDAHTNFNEMMNLGLTRKQAKIIHQPLLHGGTLNGLLAKVHEVTKSTELTMEQMKAKLYDAYGPCVDNIIHIADWGTQVVCSNETKVHWTLPDGFKATHKSYFESAHTKISAVSCNPKHKGFTGHTIIKDMPYATNNMGIPLPLKSICKETGEVIPAVIKIRGLYANVTHSLDAYVLRHIAIATMDEGMPIMLKHDDFIVHPSSYETVMSTAQLAFGKLHNTNHYQMALNQIAQHSVQRGCTAPDLLVGNAKDVTKQATAFLMP
jgi:hypothetical protein